MKRALFMIFFLSLPAALHAEGVGACDNALVKSTYDRVDTSFSDYRLAVYVSRETYDEVKHNGGVNVVIYGVPVGANYDDFHSSALKEINSRKESISQNEAHNLMWTGLDPKSNTAYLECLRTTVFSSPGLHMAVKSATQSDIALIVKWTPQGTWPGTIPVTWSHPKGFPDTVTQGETIIVVARPHHELTLAVNWMGLADSVIIEPLPPALTQSVTGIPSIEGKWCRRDNPQAPVMTISRSGGQITVKQPGPDGQLMDVADLLTLGPNAPAGTERLFISRDLETNNVDEFTLIEQYKTMSNPGLRWSLPRQRTDRFHFSGRDVIELSDDQMVNQIGNVSAGLAQNVHPFWARCGS